MGFSKETTKSRQALLRSLKTLFFLLAMFFSLLLSAAPIFLILIDAILPSALLSAAQTPLSPRTIYSHLANYSFRSSLIDIPLISLLRSALILCFYTLCDGPALSRGPYLGMAIACSVSSLLFVSFKASFVFRRWDGLYHGVRGLEMALFVCSWVLAVGHMVVAYRTSCRERRKMLIYNIDIEAVTLYKKGFFKYQKLIEEERMRKDDHNNTKLGKL